MLLIQSLDEFMEWAKNNGWNVILNQEKTDLPDVIKRRYDIPVEWYDSICRLQVCENHSQTKWFLTPKDFFQQNGGFHWNEFELQSLEYTDNDSSVTAYWDKHLPIILCADGDYAYYAINTENGNVVYGYEPEYEESTVISESFSSFINKVISGEIAL